MCNESLSPKIKVYTLTVVIVTYFLLELVTSHLTHSLTLLIDAYHSLYNIVGMIGFIIAMKVRGHFLTTYHQGEDPTLTFFFCYADVPRTHLKKYIWLGKDWSPRHAYQYTSSCSIELFCGGGGHSNGNSRLTFRIQF